MVKRRKQFVSERRQKFQRKGDLSVQIWKSKSLRMEELFSAEAEKEMVGPFNGENIWSAADSPAGFVRKS